jgi:hypothetical protein
LALTETQYMYYSGIPRSFTEMMRSPVIYDATYEEFKTDKTEYVFSNLLMKLALLIAD